MSPVRVTKMKWNWIRQNLLLILTFSGVICGVGLGTLIPSQNSYNSFNNFKLTRFPVLCLNLICTNSLITSKDMFQFYQLQFSTFLIYIFLYYIQIAQLLIFTNLNIDFYLGKILCLCGGTSWFIFLLNCSFTSFLL